MTEHVNSIATSANLSDLSVFATSTLPLAFKAEPFSHSLILTNPKGEQVGRLNYENGQLEFEGGVHESAESFLTYLKMIFHDSIEAEVKRRLAQS